MPEENIIILVQEEMQDDRGCDRGVKKGVKKGVKHSNTLRGRAWSGSSLGSHMCVSMIIHV